MFEILNKLNKIGLKELNSCISQDKGLIWSKISNNN